MTLGQRIQELRKQRGLSQEALGDALGVSRQAVSKWEGDNGIPELDTLIAMSRLFEVTVGQLLGMEKAAPEPQEIPKEVPEDREDQVEAVLRRYVEQTTVNTRQASRRGWRFVLPAAIVVTTAFLVLFAQLNSLRGTVRLLRSDLSSLQVNVSNSQSALSGQIRNTIYDVLAEQKDLLSTFRWEITDLDLEQETAALRLEATMKEYAAGSRLQFSADWQKVDGTEGQTSGDWVDGPNFQDQITLPLNGYTAIRIRVEDAHGNLKEQVIETPIYELHPDHFRLSAHNLSTPFAITIKGSVFSVSTSRAEQAYITLESVFPEFLWPEQARLTAQVNGTQVLDEALTLTPSDGPQVFHASLREVYCELTLKEGDVLDIVLTVTDNLGRTEEFTYRTGVKNGKLERSPLEVPAIAVDS